MPLDRTSLIATCRMLACTLAGLGCSPRVDDMGVASASSGEIEGTGSEDSGSSAGSASSASSTSGPSTMPSDPIPPSTGPDPSSGPGTTTDTGDGTTWDETTTWDDGSSGTGTLEICPCADNLPQCAPAVEEGVACDEEANVTCCRPDGHYTCQCPFAPPCTWTKDPCN